jgi:branched-chain amino acid transport system ATP-binding protein
MTVALGCSGLAGGHGDVMAFRDLDLELAVGEVLALLGPNGAGKTTFLQTLAGLLRSSAGSVSVGARPLANGNPAAANRAGIVLVPDNRCLFTTRRVGELSRSRAALAGQGRCVVGW